MSKRYIYYGSAASSFNPLNIDGLQLYLNKGNATASSWLDQSTNAYDFTQAIGTRQPVINANSVDFTTNDDLNNSTANAFSSDSSGIFFFSGYHNTANAIEYFLTSANEAVVDNFIIIGLRNSTINIQNNNGVASSRISGTTTIANGAYFYGYIKSTGTAYEISINGVVQSLSIVGNNDGTWFSDIVSRDNINLSYLKRTTDLWKPSKQNKIIYSNATLSAGVISDIDTFMSVPSN